MPPPATRFRLSDLGVSGNPLSDHVVYLGTKNDAESPYFCDQKNIGFVFTSSSEYNKDDDRVSAVIDWLGKNYTLNENPGMGQEGLFYYFHLMSKALTTQGVKTLKGPNSKSIDWKNELAAKLISLQKKDGSWKNSNKRWMEGDPNLTTSYVLVALSLLVN